MVTGFDALHARASKPMRGHGLIKAIARQPRVPRQERRLVVDYIGIGDG
jgi:type I site-specific restriction-modification system R (restriction) subunit